MSSSEKENIFIAAGDCRVSLLPHFGGKIASITVRGHELLQTPIHAYGPRTRTMGFNEGDASGWDECLPSVSGCTVQTPTGAVEVPDHGDVWRVEWTVVEQSPLSVTLRAECFSLPLTLTRTLTLSETPNGYRLHADYHLTNHGSTEVPWSWSAHPGYLADPGDELDLPSSITSLKVEWTRNDRLTKVDGRASWPIASLTAGGTTDLRVSTSTHSGVGDKLFAGPLSATENWATLTRKQIGVRLRITHDASRTPYLGLWICQDGYPEEVGLKQHCVAIEPCTAPVDALAIEGPWSLRLAPGQSVTGP